MLEEIQEEAEVTTPDKIKKKWRAKVENKTLETADLINYFQLSASYFLTVSRKDNASDVGESFELFLVKFCSNEYYKNPKRKFSVRQRESSSLFHYFLNFLFLSFMCSLRFLIRCKFFVIRSYLSHT